MSKRTSIRIPDDLYEKLAEQARQERRTISNLIIARLSESFDRENFNVAANVASDQENTPPKAS